VKARAQSWKHKSCFTMPLGSLVPNSVKVYSLIILERESKIKGLNSRQWRFLMHRIELKHSNSKHHLYRMYISAKTSQVCSPNQIDQVLAYSPPSEHFLFAGYFRRRAIIGMESDGYPRILISVHLVATAPESKLISARSCKGVFYSPRMRRLREMECAEF
jgi:hypothetical protein